MLVTNWMIMSDISNDYKLLIVCIILLLLISLWGLILFNNKKTYMEAKKKKA